MTAHENEHTPIGESLFEELSLISEEPSLTFARKNALEADLIVGAQASVTGEEAKQIYSELDRPITGLIGEKASISGMIRYYNSDEEAVIERYFEDIPAIFNGFTVAPRYKEDVGKEDWQAAVRYSHSVDPAYFHILSAVEAGITRIPVTSKLDTIIDFESVSKERAQAWLEHSYPSIIESLDMRVLNNDTEVDSLNSLRGYSIDLDTLEDPMMVRDCIEVYLNSLLTLDTAVPYSARIDGKLFRFIGEKEGNEIGVFEPIKVISSTDDKHLFLFEGCRIIPVSQDENMPTQYEVAVVMKTVSKSLYKEESIYMVPLSSLHSISSLRHDYYSR